MDLGVLDLFCGAGGFSLGFERMGYTIVAGIDDDEAALASYRQNANYPGYQLDLSKTPAEVIFDVANISPDDVDVVIGGPPCQSFSFSGKRDPNDERDELVREYFDIVEYANADAFVIENVEGITSKQDGRILEWIVDRAEGLGYDVQSEVLVASDYGVPQARERLFIVGVRDGSFEFPEPMEDGPTPARVAFTMTGTYPNERETDHADKTVEKALETPKGKGVYGSNRQIRLDPEKPSPTVTASNNHFAPWGREITFREAAVLQSFPLYWSFYGNRDKQRNQVGNAVPPLLSQAIAGALRDVLASESVILTHEVKKEMDELDFRWDGVLTESEAKSVWARAQGLTYEQVGELLGGKSDGAAYQNCTRAREKYESAKDTISIYERLIRG